MRDDDNEIKLNQNNSSSTNDDMNKESKDNNNQNYSDKDEIPALEDEKFEELPTLVELPNELQEHIISFMTINERQLIGSQVIDWQEAIKHINLNDEKFYALLHRYSTYQIHLIINHIQANNHNPRHEELFEESLTSTTDIINAYRGSAHYQILNELLSDRESASRFALQLSDDDYAIFAITTLNLQNINCIKLESVIERKTETLNQNLGNLNPGEMAREKFFIQTLQMLNAAAGYLQNQENEDYRKEFLTAYNLIAYSQEFKIMKTEMPEQLLDVINAELQISDYDDATSEAFMTTPNSPTANNQLQYYLINPESLNTITLVDQLNKVHQKCEVARTSGEIKDIRHRCAEELVKFALSNSDKKISLHLLQTACDHKLFEHRKPISKIFSSVLTQFSLNSRFKHSDSKKILLEGIETLQKQIEPAPTKII